jgi:sugar lactone lactonase YvrE
MMYSASQLGTTATLAPTLTISPTDAGVYSDGGFTRSIDHPEAMAFDGQGNLWLANAASPSVVMFSANSLGTGGAVPPAIVWTAANLDYPNGLAFDTAGDLWVSNCGSRSALLKYPVSQLGGTSTPTPSVVLVSDGGPAFSCPENIAFDASEHLWVTYCCGGGADGLAGFSPSNLATSGFQVPSVYLTNVTDGGKIAFDGPTGLAFDNAGDLWVTTYNPPSHLIELTPSQLTTTAQVQPAASIQVPTLDYSGIAFDPPPAGLLPLFP